MRILAPLALIGALGTTAVAQDMSDAERQAFRSEVRAYLLENPEVLMEAIQVLETQQADAANARDVALVATHADQLFNSDTSYVGGNPDGDFTIVEFLDYRCGYCRRAHPEVAELLERDPNIRYVIKELPILGEQSLIASQYALAVQMVAGQEAYYDVHSTLMEFKGDISEDILLRLSDTYGLDHSVVTDKMSGPEVAAIIDENYALAQQLAITGTPTFVFEEQVLRGYLPLAEMEQVIVQMRADGD